MPRQQRKAEQQRQQVGQSHPLAPRVRQQSGQPGPFAEGRAQQLVDGDHQRSAQRAVHGIDGSAGDQPQHGGKQEEFERNAGHPVSSVSYMGAVVLQRF